ncbi:MAG: PstS family phosphate ABC transporter substrate-binding protein [Gemmatimonadota bacterium]
MTGRRRTFRGWAAAVVVALLAAGPGSAAAATIRISGTGGAVQTFRILARAFQKSRPDVAVAVLPNIGSSGGIRAVLAGKLDIGLSARPLNDAESGRGIVARAYARTPMVFAAYRNVRTGGLTSTEVAEIYSGSRSRWEDGKRIRLVLRPPSDSDIPLLQSMSPAMSEAVAGALRREGMTVAMTDQDAADVIERVPGAFGAVTLAIVLSERRAIRIVALDGIVPSLRTMGDGSYPHAKTFYVVTKRGVPPAVRAFLDFVRSPEGAAILSENGQAPVR